MFKPDKSNFNLDMLKLNYEEKVQSTTEPFTKREDDKLSSPDKNRLTISSPLSIRTKSIADF